MIIVFLGLYLAQIYVTKNGFPERGIAGIRAAEVGAAEIRATEVRSPKVSAAEVRAPEIRAAEIPPRKVFFTGYERD
jgi:hypothetical protein